MSNRNGELLSAMCLASMAGYFLSPLQKPSEVRMTNAFFNHNPHVRPLQAPPPKPFPPPLPPRLPRPRTQFASRDLLASPQGPPNSPQVRSPSPAAPPPTPFAFQTPRRGPPASASSSPLQRQAQPGTTRNRQVSPPSPPKTFKLRPRLAQAPPQKETIPRPRGHVSPAEDPASAKSPTTPRPPTQHPLLFRPPSDPAGPAQAREAPPPPGRAPGRRPQAGRPLWAPVPLARRASQGAAAAARTRPTSPAPAPPSSLRPTSRPRGAAASRRFLGRRRLWPRPTSGPVRL